MTLQTKAIMTDNTATCYYDWLLILFSKLTIFTDIRKLFNMFYLLIFYINKQIKIK